MSQKRIQFRNVPPSKNKTFSSPPRLHLLCLASLPLLYPAYVHTALHKRTGGSCLATSLSPPPTPRREEKKTPQRKISSYLQLENSFGAIFMAYFQFTVTASSTSYY